MSARSLQRRLAEEQTSFHALLDELRRELARHDLERRTTPIEAVAYLMGFSEVSAFTRAGAPMVRSPPARMRKPGGGGR
jgi:AraC-like DNA-binding protein